MRIVASGNLDETRHIGMAIDAEQHVARRPGVVGNECEQAVIARHDRLLKAVLKLRKRGRARGLCSLAGLSCPSRGNRHLPALHTQAARLSLPSTSAASARAFSSSSHHLGERRNVVVALDDRRHRAEAP